MQEIIKHCINELQNNRGIVLNYTNINFLLCDVNNDNIIKNTTSSFKAILVREDIYLEDYCKGVIPMVYDLIEYSSKPLFLQLPKLKNASEYLKINNTFAMYHIPKDEFLNTLCSLYRKAIAIIELKNKNDNSYYHVNLPNLKHPFKPRAIISLLENGEIKVIEK